MNEVEASLEAMEPARRALAEHYYARLRELVPEAVPGRKYAMACYVHHGLGLLAVLPTKAGLSLVPFSGSVNREVAGEFETSANGGSLYCTPERPFPDDRFDELVRLRVAEIEG